MKRNSERTYWMTNNDWYTVNLEKDCFELTDAAPPHVQKSFSMWNKTERKTVRKIIRKLLHICKAYLDM